MDILELKGSDLPISIKMDIGEKTFIYEFVYRGFDDRIICNLYDEFDNEICMGEKLVFGVPMFHFMQKDALGNNNLNLPSRRLMPYSIDGKEVECGIIGLGVDYYLMFED